MGNLFPEEVIEPTKVEVQPQEPKKGKYHARNGRFTDKTTAHIAALEKESEINKRNAAFWKRQAKRLSEDYNTEHQLVLDLKAKLKQLEEILNGSYIQQEKISASGQSTQHGGLPC